MYQPLGDMTYQDYLEFITSRIPIECHPNNLGLNTNSNITADYNQCENLLANMQLMNAGKLDDKKQEKEQTSSTQEKKPVNNDLKLIESV